MATYSVTHIQRRDNVAVVATLTSTDIAVGQSVVVAGLGNGLDGTHVVAAVPGFLFVGVDEYGDLEFDYDAPIVNQILFLNDGADLQREAADPWGSLTYTVTCSWITSNMVQEFLGISTATANDTAFLATCVSAANAWAYRKRQESGYFDSLSTVPGGDVKLGTIIYAASQYRSRGSIDGIQSFQDYATSGTPQMSMGQILSLLGCNRAQVA
jgi:hypothetical protein